MDQHGWDVFWKKRNERLLGQIISWVRHRCVTPTLTKLVLSNTRKGTLTEGGCGTGEISLSVAKERGDRVILVDTSAEALELAKKNAQRFGIAVETVKCDLRDLSSHLAPLPDRFVFNVGVIEHLPDCSEVLFEMAAVSGSWALSVIPEHSTFWRLFLFLSNVLHLVPDGFFIRLYDENSLKHAAEDAGLEVLGVDRVRVMGVIPYLGIRFRLSSELP